MAPDPYISRATTAPRSLAARALKVVSMSRASRIPNLGGAERVRAAPSASDGTGAPRGNCRRSAWRWVGCWPELPVEALAADFVFFDADLGFDEQFPWKPGAAPMPLVALIGSEAPGRIEWALSHNADAQLLKPVGNAGVSARC